MERIMKMDMLSVGLFGLAVGASTLGLMQLGYIPQSDALDVAIISLVFGGLVQLLAGFVDISYHDQLGGTALTMYGAFWTTIYTVKIIDMSYGLLFDNKIFLPIVAIYALFSAVMIFNTGHKTAVLMFLHIVITVTFFTDFTSKLGNDLNFQLGIEHMVIAVLAFYHAMGTLVNAYTGRERIPLGAPMFFKA